MRIDRSPRVIVSTPDLAYGNDRYRALMVRYQAADLAAFDSLVEGLAPALVAYLDALAPGMGQDETLVDEVFLTIHRTRGTYDPRRPFWPWAAAIARHVVLSRYAERRRTRRR